MLAVALQLEVSAYIDAHAEEVDENGHRLVVRNGHHNEREVITAAGSVPARPSELPLVGAQILVVLLERSLSGQDLPDSSALTYADIGI
jgi:hypothetical protein